MKQKEMEAMINLAERMVLADKIDDMVRIAALRSLERTEIMPWETPTIEVTEDDTPDGMEEMYAAWAAEAEEERKQLEEEDMIAEAYEHERQQQQNRRGCRCGRKLKPGTEREQRIMDLFLEMDMRTGEIRLA